MHPQKTIPFLIAALLITIAAHSQPSRWRIADSDETRPLSEVFLRDPCILADASSQTYYLIASWGNSVIAHTSKDLKTWQGPKTIFRTPENIWKDIPVLGIWAPEMHKYKDKYYLFLTFNTRTEFQEQWRNWRPRVYRGSQVLVAESPTGPFEPFENRSTLPPDMMTLDGTLWVEDGVPYMVFCHEWVQISDGAIKYVRLKDDLSATDGDPVHLFRASYSSWSRHGDGGEYVTDGPYLYTSESGKLFMIWSSFSPKYTVGLAISDSGKLAGPWRQQENPIIDTDAGHGMLFKTFDGKLMMVLHSPNNRKAQPHIYEMIDTGETLKIKKEFTDKEE